MRRAKELLERLSPILGGTDSQTGHLGVDAAARPIELIPDHHGSEDDPDLNDLEMKELQKQRREAFMGRCLSRYLRTVTWFLRKCVKAKTLHDTESVHRKWSSHL